MSVWLSLEWTDPLSCRNRDETTLKLMKLKLIPNWKRGSVAKAWYRKPYATFLCCVFRLAVVKPIESNHDGQSEQRKMTQRANENSKQLYVCVIKSEKREWPRRDRLLVLSLIGWESGASFLDQSHHVAKQTRTKPGFLLLLNWKLIHGLSYLWDSRYQTLRKLWRVSNF